MIAKASPSESVERHLTFCCHVRTASMVIGVYYLLASVMLCVDQILDVAYGKNICGSAYKEQLPAKERIIDVTTDFILIAVLFISSLHMLYGIIKFRERLLLSFLLLQCLDIFLSVLSLFSPSWGLPGTINYDKVVTHWQKLSGKKEFTSNEMTKLFIIFTVVFTLCILIKVYVVNCVIRCYRFIKAHAEAARDVSCKYDINPMIKLPSYDEALMTPPAYKKV
ncbi:lysosomal-associated transmembrane protein 5-like [Polypterus senegalus]|uniref:lysosomal-associated transmembrane protein 5-like n=1 Tax=Polypterus senegalus TaxID=55291 RepID=UPI001963AB7F|nr:lysosomal-associated transmembrane protein 5-like [Polypterus senegalus]